MSGPMKKGIVASLPGLVAALLLATAGAGCSSGGTTEPTLSDEELLALLSVVDEVHARAETALASNPDPTSDDLWQAIKDTPGVSASGKGAGQMVSAWVKIGARKITQWVMVDPYPELANPQAPAPAPWPPAPAPGQGDGKTYAFINIAYPAANIGSSEIISLLNSKGYSRSPHFAGTSSVMRNLGTMKILYICTHFMMPDLADPDDFYALLLDHLPAHEKDVNLQDTWPNELRVDIQQNRIGVMTVFNPKEKLCIDYLGFNQNFVATYLSFEQDSLFFLDSCQSGAARADGFRQAAFGKNLSVFVGWDGDVTWNGENFTRNGWKAVTLFFDRWLGTNQVDPKLDPPQRPFDAHGVLQELSKKNLDITVFESRLAQLKVFPSAPAKFAGAPSIELIQVKEKDKELKIGGIFGKDPGSDRRKVKLAGQALEVKEWKEEEITCTLPKSSGGSQVDVEIAADDHEGNKVQITEWTVKFTHEGHSEMKDTDTGEVFATSDGKYTFDVKFRADVHEYREEAGQEPMNKVIVPFEVEDDASMSWNGTARFKDQTEPFSGTTTNLYDIDYTDPGWPGSLPADTDLLAGEGYIDMNTRKLYLFLVGIGDDSGSGTFNIGTQTDCRYEHDQYTNRVYLIFDLDENFEIENGSCTDQITDQQGQYTYSGTRSWEFTTRSPPDKDAAR